MAGIIIMSHTSSSFLLEQRFRGSEPALGHRGACHRRRVLKSIPSLLRGTMRLPPLDLLSAMPDKWQLELEPAPRHRQTHFSARYADRAVQYHPARVARAPLSARNPVAHRRNQHAAAEFHARVASLLSTDLSPASSSMTLEAPKEPTEERWAREPAFVDALERWNGSLRELEGLLSNHYARQANVQDVSQPQRAAAGRTIKISTTKITGENKSSTSPSHRAGHNTVTPQRRADVPLQLRLPASHDVNPAGAQVSDELPLTGSLQATCTPAPLPSGCERGVAPAAYLGVKQEFRLGTAELRSVHHIVQKGTPGYVRAEDSNMEGGEDSSTGDGPRLPSASSLMDPKTHKNIRTILRNGYSKERREPGIFRSLPVHELSALPPRPRRPASPHGSKRSTRGHPRVRSRVRSLSSEISTIGN